MKAFRKKYLVLISLFLFIGANNINAGQSLYGSPQSTPKFNFQFSVGSKAYKTVDSQQLITFKQGENLKLQITMPTGKTYPGKRFNFTVEPYSSLDNNAPIEAGIYTMSYTVDNTPAAACIFSGDTPHACVVTYAAKNDKEHTSILHSLKHSGSTHFHALKASIEINKPPVNYGRINVKQSDINIMSAADAPEDDQINLNTVYEYFPAGFDVTKIKEVHITITPKSKTIGDIYKNMVVEPSYTCIISNFTTPNPETGSFVCDEPLNFRPYRVGQTTLKTTGKVILKQALLGKNLPQPIDVVTHVGTLIVGSDHVENDSSSYVIGRNILHSGTQLIPFDRSQSKLLTTDKTGLRYMISDALSNPNRVSILSSSLIASAAFDVTKDGSEAVVSKEAFTKTDNIYKSPGSGNILTSFALANQGQEKVSLTFANGRGTQIQRVLDYVNTSPNQWQPIYLGALGPMDMVSYINIPVNYSDAFLNQNFAESMGYYYKFFGTEAGNGVQKLADNPEASTKSSAMSGVALSYKDMLFSVTPDKASQTQLYYLDDKTFPTAPQWQKTSVGYLLPPAAEGIQSVDVMFNGTLVIGYGADTKVLVCQYQDSQPYYDRSRCTPIIVFGQGAIVEIAFDGQNRIYTLTSDGTVTRLVKNKKTGYYETDGTTFYHYQKEFQIQQDTGPGATSMVVIGNVEPQ